MTEPQQSALADLARALTDAGWEVSIGNHFYSDETCLRAEQKWIAGSRQLSQVFVTEEGHVRVAEELKEMNVAVEMLPEVWQALDLIRAWQSPPRPDAASFAKAVERIADCGIRLGVDYAKGVDSSRDDGYLAEAKAALLAFAPSADAATITEPEWLQNLPVTPWNERARERHKSFTEDLENPFAVSANGGAHE